LFGVPPLAPPELELLEPLPELELLPELVLLFESELELELPIGVVVLLAG
jgi:hypothetical protein